MTDSTPSVKTPTPRRKTAPQLDIVVSDEIIEKSKERDSSHCMVAEAVKAAFRERKGYEPGHVSVDIQTIRFTDRNPKNPTEPVRIAYQTPRAVQKAILQFDQGITPDEFQFRLREGQVTATRPKKLREGKKEATPAQREGAARARAVKYDTGLATDPGTDEAVNKVREASQAEESPAITDLRKGKLVVHKSTGMAQKQGGALPPTTPVGRRRAFGLRAMDL